MIQFYIHFDIQTNQIRSISASNVLAENTLAIEVEYDLGMKFMLGEENPINWSIIKQDDSYSLKKVDPTTVKLNRIDMGLGIYEVVKNPWDKVRLAVDKVENVVEIHYDGEAILKATHPVKMYFTREGDMSYLKCAFSLDVNILNQIKFDNNLTSWPNPVKLHLKDVDDLSVYAVFGPLTVSFIND